MDVVIDQLRREITSGRWPVGEKIPPESSLVRTLGVSRLSVREAVRALVHAGLLATRQGDGTYVTASDETSVALTRLLADVADRDVEEVRQGLDVVAARLAARRRTPADLEELRAIAARRQLHYKAEELKEFVEADIAFHLCVARAGHNPLLLDLYTTLSTALRDTILADDMRHSTTDAHQDLLEAIEAGDPVAADAAAQAILAV
ncbi:MULTISPECIES: FCD domain-containing protein [unclassified Streptomyces]|uniref:FadR/GntR family transcriptional regulator n=1 Tax=unclassified Streptomyces TaxID=2593676 RepID=UPI0021ACC1E6|nr:FCD domain-containing protein [Streptomyces sp. PsTaAH-137]